MLNKLQNRYLRQTFGQIIHEDAVQTFEQKLKELSPRLNSIDGIGRLLLGTLAVLIQNLHDAKTVKKTAEIFISRYELQTEDLQNIRQAFCSTLDQHMEQELSQTMQAAWNDFFGNLLLLLPEPLDDL